MKSALIASGGWDGHEPEKVSRVFKDILAKAGVSVETTEGVECFDDAEFLRRQDLIVPVITMGKITGDQARNLSEAVAGGTGLAGCHGGMCDAFRNEVL